MKPMLQSVFWALVIVAALLMTWLLMPATFIFAPVAWEYNWSTQKITFTRIVRVDGLVMDFRHTVYPADNSAACHWIGRGDQYRRDTQVVVYDVPPELERCLRVPGASARLTWTVYLFGQIPLRPIYMNVPSGFNPPPFGDAKTANP